MKKSLIFNLLISGLFLISCQGNADKTSADASDKDMQATTSNAENKTAGKYQIKTGIVTYTSQVYGMDQLTIITFDDYGKKEVTDTYTEAMGVKLHNRTIVKDGYSFNLNMDEKRGTKVKMAGTGAAIDYTNLTKEIEQKMNLKKTGSETLLGKNCDIYSFDYKEMSTKGTTSVYKGIALKSKVNAMGMDVTLTATKFEENPSISQDIFEIPDGFEIIEN